MFWFLVLTFYRWVVNVQNYQLNCVFPFSETGGEVKAPVIKQSLFLKYQGMSNKKAHSAVTFAYAHVAWLRLHRTFGSHVKQEGAAIQILIFFTHQLRDPGQTVFPGLSVLNCNDHDYTEVIGCCVMMIKWNACKMPSRTSSQWN